MTSHLKHVFKPKSKQELKRRKDQPRAKLKNTKHFCVKKRQISVNI